MTGLQHNTKQHSLYKGLDMYRKVPVDFLESTKRGSFLSIFAILLTATLLYKETKSFMEETLVTNMQLDMSDTEKEKLRINFNITMMDLKCDFIQLDALSIFGEEQNVQQNVLKRGIDSDGVKKRYMSRNKQQDDIQMFDPTIDESFEDMLQRKQGNQDILDLTPDTFDDVLQQNQFVFVDYYASWCSHCRALMPTWEALAEIMNTASTEKSKEALEAHKQDLENAATHNGEMKDVWTEERLKHAEEDAFQVPVIIAKVDCVDHAELCRTHLIGAYPTLRLFINGERYGGDFYGDRTVLSFTDYLATVEEQYLEKKGTLNEIHDTQTEKSHKMSEEKGGSKEGREADFHKKKHRRGNIVDDFNLMDDDYYRVMAQDDDLVRKGRYKHSIHNEWIDKDHPGCEVSGFLIVDRVPGNFHLLARSSTHDLVPQMTNTSHQINHLSFGDPYVRQRLENGQLSIPNKLLPSDLSSKLKPMDNNVYVNYNLHEAYHHYLKLVTTNFEFSSDKTNKENRYNYYSKNRPIKVYQTKSQSQIVYYQTDVIPEAKFQYDFSPVSMTFRQHQRKWYDYMTSIMAIVGGMFTVIGMIEGTAGTVARKLSKRRR